jgi:hypothetical protein
MTPRSESKLHPMIQGAWDSMTGCFYPFFFSVLLMFFHINERERPVLFVLSTGTIVDQ